jgi:hypothetical protein
MFTAKIMKLLNFEIYMSKIKKPKFPDHYQL